jgi:hypothetical protein
MTTVLQGIVFVPLLACTFTLPSELLENETSKTLVPYRIGILAFLTALRSVGASVAPLPTTLSALPGFEVGNVQRIPRRLKLAFARLELRIVILVSTLSASPCETFMMSAKYLVSG